MELTHLLTTICSGLTLVVVYFLKLLISEIKEIIKAGINDIEEMKSEAKSQEKDIALLSRVVDNIESDVKKHHGKIGAQSVKSSKMETSIALIKSEVEHIASRLPEKENPNK